MARDATTRKTQIGRLANAMKADNEFVFILREDLGPSDELVEAELLFDLSGPSSSVYKRRQDISEANEPCTVDVCDTAWLGLVGWTGQRGMARWRTVEVTKDGETTQQLIGEVVSFENIGPLHWAKLKANMGWTQNIAVTMTICGKFRDDLYVKDVHGYIPSGKVLRKDWHVRCVWNYDENCFELLDCPYCPVAP